MLTISVRNPFLSTPIVSGFLTLTILVFGATLTFAEIPACIKKEDLDRTPQGWWQKVSGAIFKVYIIEDGEEIPLGTATLIDKRGYFVTASHIFDGNSDANTPAQKTILLVSFNPTIPRIKGREIFHRPSPAAADISLIKAEMNVEMADQVSIVDPLFDFPQLPSRLILLGYKEKMVDPDFHEFTPVGPISTQKEYIRSRGDRPYFGESGSLGINQAGQGVGILEGYDRRGREIDRSLFRLTPIARGREILSKIEHSDLVKRLMNNFLQGNYDYVTNTLQNSTIPTLDLYVFTNEVMKNMDAFRQYFNSSTTLRKALRYKLICQKLYDSEDNFIQALGSMTKEVRFEGGTIASGIYKELTEKAIPKEIRRPYLDVAHRYFKEAENNYSIGEAPGFTWLTNSREEYAQYQAEYAYVLNEGYTLYPDMGITKESVDKKIKLALAWDNKNELAYKVAATGEKDLSFYKPTLNEAIAELPTTDARSLKLRSIRETDFMGNIEIGTPKGDSIRNKLDVGSFKTR